MYSAEPITDVDYADDIALLANAPAQSEFGMHNLGLLVNADKAEFMSFNQRGYTATLNGRSLKLVDKFTYLGSSVSSP